MKKQFYTTSFLIVLLAVFGFANHVVQSVGGNLPITQVAANQSKAGGLSVNKLVVTDQASPQTLARLTTAGWLGLGMPTSGNDTNPSTQLDVRGQVRLSELSEKDVQVCANKDGDIVRCGFVEFTYRENCYPKGDCNKAVTTHKFTVPPGVSEITVELWGAGGMGYFADSSTKYNESPDTKSNCLQDLLTNPKTYAYNCPKGGSSYFKDTDGSTVLARAGGGEAPSSTSSGGSGGSTNVSSNSKVTMITQNSGAPGGTGASGQSYYTQSISCGSSSHTIRNGGQGGQGGYGGSSGSGGASILGPRGGFQGASANCEKDTAPNNGSPFKGVDGFDGIRGSGGSGASGHGGSAYSDLYSETCTGSSCISARAGYPGGGGGGYVKIKVTVSYGDVYTLELSHGGAFETSPNVPSVSGLVCDFISKNTCFQDTKSGKGGHGFARISY